MKTVLLIYPFFKFVHEKSAFRFPPLGIAYIASSLRARGHKPVVLDCTFLSKEEALRKALETKADIAGIYSMITMREHCLFFARHLKDRVELLVAGGPLPSADPSAFLDDFDVVVKGEGEQTMADLVDAFENQTDMRTIPGIAFKSEDPEIPGSRRLTVTQAREVIKNLDLTPFPARDLLPNAEYIWHGRKKYGYAVTTVMTTRGCPFTCEFCSNEVFGNSYRERSVENVLEEVKQALALGYNRIHFADDVFTLNKDRIRRLCSEILARDMKFDWECLARVDSLDPGTALLMRKAGCARVFFGIESGNDNILELMTKNITRSKSSNAVRVAHGAGLKTGAFFILFYPGETDKTVLETIRFALSLPLDYLSFTLPYPIPGTKLYERLKDRPIRDWRQPDALIFDHEPIFDGDFSELKMKFGILKGKISFFLKKKFGIVGWPAFNLFGLVTDLVFRFMH